MARSRRSRKRGRGAAQAIKTNVAKSKVARPSKPRTVSKTDGNQSARRLGGAGGAPNPTFTNRAPGLR